VDHAAHNNDAAAQLWDFLAFDDAIAAVLRFAEKRPNTLVVITTDHGNANPGLNGMGNEYRDSNACLERLLAVRQSFAAVTPQLQTGGRGAAVRPAAELVQEVSRKAFGFELSAAEVEAVRAAAGRVRGHAVNRQFDSLVGVLGQALGNHVGVGWTGVSHTSDYSIVTALGPG
jgi:alkaline phosphatase